MIRKTSLRALQKKGINIKISFNHLLNSLTPQLKNLKNLNQMTDKQWQTIWDYFYQEHDRVLLEGDRWELERILWPFKPQKKTT